MAPPKAKPTSSSHPLQRLRSPSRTFSLLIHTLGLYSFTQSYRYLLNNPTAISSSYGWHWQYLTILGLASATLTFLAGLLADITLSRSLFAAKNALTLASAPLEVLVSLLYWGISAVDRNLVVPPDIYIAPIDDLGFHAAPSILLVIDLLLLSPPWTVTALPAMGLSSALAVAYWAWVEHCFGHNGFYPYPLFEKLDTTQRIILFGTAALTMTASTVALQWLYARVNGCEDSAAVKRARSAPD